jgi:diguanylate cyclase (GGDEF)-like protein
LTEIGAAMQASLRAGDVVGRWGGDEYLAVLPRTDNVGVGPLVERVKEGVASKVVVHGRHMEVRAGFAVATPGQTEIDDLILAVSESLRGKR